MDRSISPFIEISSIVFNNDSIYYVGLALKSYQPHILDSVQFALIYNKDLRVGKWQVIMKHELFRSSKAQFRYFWY